ncbi:MAG: ATPase, partial [Frankiales bacterium]|nr:ATPase [Frankiales bacterium]
RLEAADGSPVAAGVLRVHADRASVAQREERLQARFTAAHPTVPVVQVAAQAGDVHDLDGLRSVGADLASGVAAAVPRA